MGGGLGYFDFFCSLTIELRFSCEKFLIWFFRYTKKNKRKKEDKRANDGA
ncbi:hypothetical protein CpecG_0139 [Chlamydia pecorum MC/MarsBar]|nr:hypothetical protein CpecS_0142 [Chlamydia pecorum VR629]ETF39039.1 hypothetical protein CpecF_0139 [Chlamydia pecorum DBDeUG]ETF39715.1 hypothetical protein CpecG_0139 [Chlamydia pecorum MC/MarsBar]ETF40765.1 hypothetical protein CpecA_0140 [Chlamydia pecorum IPTaLE]